MIVMLLRFELYSTMASLTSLVVLEQLYYVGIIWYIQTYIPTFYIVLMSWPGGQSTMQSRCKCWAWFTIKHAGSVSYNTLKCLAWFTIKHTRPVTYNTLTSLAWFAIKHARPVSYTTLACWAWFTFKHSGPVSYTALTCWAWFTIKPAVYNH